MTRLVRLATCALNQWAMDFEGNVERIIESIRKARDLGASYRLGPELEVTGYGCNDHFLEDDTYQHSVEALAFILAHADTSGIMVDLGMPVLYKGVRYNCRVIILDGKILLIRPKQAMAMDGNYRECRFFTPWRKPREVESFTLPAELREVTGQTTVPIGDAVIDAITARIGTESCEELFTPESPHIAMALDGVEVFTNGSGSHHELRKLNTRIDLICSAMRKHGGVYLYANQKGCDGERVFYDGCALICVNGDLAAQGSQLSLGQDVEVIAATVDLDDVTKVRGASPSRAYQAATAPQYPVVTLPQPLSVAPGGVLAEASILQQPKYLSPEEEIARGPAGWLWDYLRRSGLSGFFLSLSGGIDSCSSALVAYSMCRQVYQAVKDEVPGVLADLRRIVRESEYVPASAEDVCSHLLHTA